MLDWAGLLKGKPKHARQTGSSPSPDASSSSQPDAGPAAGAAGAAAAAAVPAAAAGHEQQQQAQPSASLSSSSSPTRLQGSAAHTSLPGSQSSSARAAAAQQHEKLLAEARRSKVDPVTGKVRCLACGVAFATYAQLAQHVGIKHNGLNSEDAKYISYKAAQDSAAGAAAAAAGAGAGVHAGGARLSPRYAGVSKPIALRGNRSSNLGPTLADLLRSAPQLRPSSGPSTSKRGEAAQAGPQEPGTASAAAASTSAAGAGRDSQAAGQRAKAKKATTISFGLLLPSNRGASSGAAKASKGAARTVAARPARGGVTSGRMGLGAGLAALAQGRRRLRAEGAVRKKRLSHVKQLVVQRRADKGVAAAQQQVQAASAAVSALEQYHAQLVQELQAAVQQLGASAGVQPAAVVGPVGMAAAGVQPQQAPLAVSVSSATPSPATSRAAPPEAAAAAAAASAAPAEAGAASTAPAADAAVAETAAAAVSTPSLLPSSVHSQLPPAMRVAVLQLTLPGVQAQLAKARSQLSDALAASTRAQAQHAVAYKLPVAEAPAPAAGEPADAAPLLAAGGSVLQQEQEEQAEPPMAPHTTEGAAAAQQSAAPQLLHVPQQTSHPMLGQQGPMHPAAPQSGDDDSDEEEEEEEDSDDDADGLTGLPTGWTDALSQWSVRSQAKQPLAGLPAAGRALLATPGLWATATKPASSPVTAGRAAGTAEPPTVQAAASAVQPSTQPGSTATTASGSTSGAQPGSTATTASGSTPGAHATGQSGGCSSAQISTHHPSSAASGPADEGVARAGAAALATAAAGSAEARGPGFGSAAQGIAGALAQNPGAAAPVAQATPSRPLNSAAHQAAVAGGAPASAEAPSPAGLLAIASNAPEAGEQQTSEGHVRLEPRQVPAAAHQVVAAAGSQQRQQQQVGYGAAAGSSQLQQSSLLHLLQRQASLQQGPPPLPQSQQQQRQQQQQQQQDSQARARAAMVLPGASAAGGPTTSGLATQPAPVSTGMHLLHQIATPGARAPTDATARSHHAPGAAPAAAAGVAAAAGPAAVVPQPGTGFQMLRAGSLPPLQPTPGPSAPSGGATAAAAAVRSAAAPGAAAALQPAPSAPSALVPPVHEVELDNESDDGVTSSGSLFGALGALGSSSDVLSAWMTKSPAGAATLAAHAFQQLSLTRSGSSSSSSSLLPGALPQLTAQLHALQSQSSTCLASSMPSSNSTALSAAIGNRSLSGFSVTAGNRPATPASASQDMQELAAQHHAVSHMPQASQLPSSAQAQQTIAATAQQMVAAGAQQAATQAVRVIRAATPVSAAPAAGVAAAAAAHAPRQPATNPAAMGSVGTMATQRGVIAQPPTMGSLASVNSSNSGSSSRGHMPWGSGSGAQAALDPSSSFSQLQQMVLDPSSWQQLQLQQQQQELLLDPGSWQLLQQQQQQQQQQLQQVRVEPGSLEQQQVLLDPGSWLQQQLQAQLPQLQLQQVAVGPGSWERQQQQQQAQQLQQLQQVVAQQGLAASQHYPSNMPLGVQQLGVVTEDVQFAPTSMPANLPMLLGSMEQQQQVQGSSTRRLNRAQMAVQMALSHNAAALGMAANSAGVHMHAQAPALHPPGTFQAGRSEGPPTAALLSQGTVNRLAPPAANPSSGPALPAVDRRGLEGQWVQLVLQQPAPAPAVSSQHFVGLGPQVASGLGQQGARAGGPQTLPLQPGSLGMQPGGAEPGSYHSSMGSMHSVHSMGGGRASWTGPPPTSAMPPGRGSHVPAMGLSADAGTPPLPPAFPLGPAPGFGASQQLLDPAAFLKASEPVPSSSGTNTSGAGMQMVVTSSGGAAAAVGTGARLGEGSGLQGRSPQLLLHPGMEPQAGPSGATSSAHPRSQLNLGPGPMAPVVQPGQQELRCELCHVQCNSASALNQHLASKKHLARLARQALADLEAATPQLPGSQGGSAGPSSSHTYVGPTAASHSLCKQIITTELNQVVTDLLSRIRGFQERAMLRDPIKAAAHRWFVCGLREVRKACRNHKARSVVVAPNIEQSGEEGGLDDHLQQILDLCEEHGIPVVFALTRKKLGELYGHRKRVSAVAVLSHASVDALHAHMVSLAAAGREEWRKLRATAAAAADAADAAAAAVAAAAAELQAAMPAHAGGSGSAAGGSSGIGGVSGVGGDGTAQVGARFAGDLGAGADVSSEGGIRSGGSMHSTASASMVAASAAASAPALASMAGAGAAAAGSAVSAEDVS